jgi:phage tail sheath gpL-like
MASTNISVPGIPASTKKPGAYFAINTANANRGLPANTDRILLLGQRLASGSVAANALVELPDEATARNAFGAGSVVHQMARAAFTANPYLTLSAISVDDAAGSLAATAKITPTGTGTGSGVVSVFIGAESANIAVMQGDTAAVVASGIVAAINAKPDWAVTAAVVAADVVLTAKAKGTLGNGIVYTATNNAPGITIALTSASSGQLAGGQTDPSLAAALTAIFAAGHTLLVTSLADAANLALLRNHAAQVSGPLEQREATVIWGNTGSLSTATTQAGTLNFEWASVAWFRGTASGPWEVAAAYAAIISSESDPANPLNDLIMPGLNIPLKSAWPIRSEQEIALNNGVTPIYIGPGQNAQIVRAVSTRTLDAAGIRDETLLDITTMRTLGAVRRVSRAAVTKLGVKKITPRNLLRIRSALLVALIQMEKLEWVKNVEQNKPSLLVEIDLSNPKQVNARIPADIVDGLHIFGAVIDLI